jgi:TorA maturation chaperone TorD
MPTRTPPTVRTAESASRRSLAYALLARSFAYPNEDGVAALREMAAAALPLLEGTPVAGLAAAAAAATREDLEEDHVHLFTMSFSPDCPTFETAVLSTDTLQQTQRMADIAGFYRAFGVDSADTGFRPDDLSVELEFMGFLCTKQAYAAEHLGAPRVGQCLRAQRLFLREHLGRWGESAGARVATRAHPSSFYALAGRALVDWLRADEELTGAGPIERVDAPMLAWPESPDEQSERLIDPDEIPLA